MKKALFTVFVVLFIDQVIKLWVKTHMEIGDSIPMLGHWFYLHFVENEGMAYGMTLGGPMGKLALSLFRMAAITAIGYYLVRVIKKGMHPALIISIALIFAGAIGNMIDSAFYGLIFSQSGPFTLAQVFPDGGGYAPFLHGKVVDMFYFPLIDTYWPEWVPFFGGDRLQFFRPVFNIADASITIGVLTLVLFQKKFYPPKVGDNSAIYMEEGEEV